MTDRPTPEYMDDLKKLYESQLDLGPAYAAFAKRLREAAVKDRANLTLTSAADLAAKGAIAYQAGDEKGGQEYIKEANEALAGLYLFTAGAKRIGPEGLERSKSGEMTATAQRAGGELYDKFRHARSLQRQLESARAELGGLEEFLK